MDGALLVSALLMGLAGAPHCAAMCGAACTFAAGGTAASARPLLVLQVGCLVSYASIGAIAATGVNGLAELQVAAPILRPAWAIVHVGAVVLGLWLLWSARAPRWLSTWRPKVSPNEARPIRFTRALPATANAGLAGACWGAIPCGLLQSAVLVAALASGPAAGAGVMTAFAGSSALGLVFAPQLWLRLRRLGNGERLAALSVRLAGALLAGSSAFALWHGLGSALCATPA